MKLILIPVRSIRLYKTKLFVAIIILASLASSSTYINSTTIAFPPQCSISISTLRGFGQ